MSPESIREHLKSYKVGQIAVPLRNGEKSRFECVAIATSDRDLEVNFLPGQLPWEDLDREGQCTLWFDVGGPTLTVVTTIEEVAGDKQLRLRKIEIQNHAQKREYFRVDAQLPVKFQTEKPGTRTEIRAGDIVGDADGINISGCGILVSFPEALPLNQQVTLRITLPAPKEETVTCIGHVVRVAENRKGDCCQVAMHFDEITQEDRDKIIAFCLIEQRRQLRLKVQVLGPA